MHPLTIALRQLGQAGGILSPSVYDTVQRLRFAPPPDPQPALTWILNEQHSDGGWGDPISPVHRFIPTLATILTLVTLDRQQYAKHIEAGLAFVRANIHYWDTDLPPDLPVAAELILPNLLDQAQIYGLQIPGSACGLLREMGAQRRQLIDQHVHIPGSRPLHSWEAWGTAADVQLIDAAGSIGHSPSATAAWLYQIKDRPGLDEGRQRAQGYLNQAGAATGLNIPGVVPTVWPIPRFEQSFSLFALATVGLLQHPIIQQSVEATIDSLAIRLGQAGALGMSDAFQIDGDTTAASLAVIRAAGRTCPDATHIFEPFMHKGYVAYPGELHSSISVASRILHQLALDGLDISTGIRALCVHQRPDGTWAKDKWNNSWLYSAWHAILALVQAPPSAMIDQALVTTIDAIRASQHADGGWGLLHSRLPETTFAILALLSLQHHPISSSTQSILLPAHQWLLKHVDDPLPTTWIGKELYTPLRVDRVLAYTALFALSLDEKS